MYKKILFITDGLESAERAIDKIIEFHETWGSDILVVHFLKHAITIPFIYESNSSKLHTLIQQEFSYYELGQAILNMIEVTFKATGVPVDLKLVVNETPEEFVKKLVDKHNIDLIVIGIQGSFSKKKIGHEVSFSKKMIKKIHCDILIV